MAPVRGPRPAPAPPVAANLLRLLLLLQLLPTWPPPAVVDAFAALAAAAAVRHAAARPISSKPSYCRHAPALAPGAGGGGGQAESLSGTACHEKGASCTAASGA